MSTRKGTKKAFNSSSVSVAGIDELVGSVLDNTHDKVKFGIVAGVNSVSPEKKDIKKMASQIKRKMEAGHTQKALDVAKYQYASDPPKGKIAE